MLWFVIHVSVFMDHVHMSLLKINIEACTSMLAMPTQWWLYWWCYTRDPLLCMSSRFLVVCWELGNFTSEDRNARLEKWPFLPVLESCMLPTCCLKCNSAVWFSNVRLACFLCEWLSQMSFRFSTALMCVCVSTWCMHACLWVVHVQKCAHKNNFCTHHFSQLTIGNAAPVPLPPTTCHTKIQHHHNDDYSTYHTYTDDYATSVTCGIKRKDGTTKLGRVGLEIIPA